MFCEISFWTETFIGQFLALLAFFAFPGIQYLLLKRFSKKEGRPELWYLPAYGFRLVIRNIPNKKILSEIKSRTIVRNRILPSAGSSVATLMDTILVEKEDFFLLPGSDQILLSFKIAETAAGKLTFKSTDKVGKVISEFSLEEISEVVSDYTANIENWLNFDIRISKRVIIMPTDLTQYWAKIKEHNSEQRLGLKKIMDIG